jgi:transposase-like protein/ribosomal protein L37AE/L43A
MDDYPQSVVEFEQRFSTEADCRSYLFQLRWPDGFRCPKCGKGKVWELNTGLLECSNCHHQTTVTAGTIFQDTRKPLTIWFRAMWYVTSQKNGASALGLKRVLGLHSYQTAWAWLHKLRRAMVRPGRDKLSGWVEVDETWFGGLEEGVAGRRKGDKALIAIAAEAKGPNIGRIRLRPIQDASAGSLHPFVEDCVEKGSTLHTDGWQGYEGLEKKGYDREITVLRGKRKEASRLLPRVHRVASLLKRWFLGTHQGAVSHQHLAYYLDEFTFRFNRRTSRSRGKLFYRLVQQAVATEPTTYRNIVDPAKALREGSQHTVVT